MEVKTQNDRAYVLENLLSEARAEADALRRKLMRYENIIVSTRLIMGHELRKPATAISGYLDLVCEDLEAQGAGRTLSYARKALNECHLLADLNEYFVELLKVGARTDMVGKESVDVPTLVRDVAAHVIDEEGTQRQIQVATTPGLPRVEVDENALRLVVMNLLENAIRYSQVDSPVRIEIEKGLDRRSLAQGEILKLRVIDRGVGIPPEYVTKVFQPFVRLHDEMTEGSGLGLTLVRSLVELNGGDVSIQSRVGEGTTVHVTVPVSQEHKKKDRVIHL